MSREFIESFEGPGGRAEVFEVVTTLPDGLAVEQVEYEVLFNGSINRTLQTMGEASVLACELSGDPRFVNPTT